MEVEDWGRKTEEGDSRGRWRREGRGERGARVPGAVGEALRRGRAGGGGGHGGGERSHAHVMRVSVSVREEEAEEEMGHKEAKWASLLF